MKPALRKLLRGAVWTVALIAIAVFVLRAFVGDVYYVDSSSMEPTLHGAADGGDYVFVRYDDAPQPRRFDLAVIARPENPEPLVKRIVALHGERVQINDGDLFIDGARLGAREPRPPLIELFDSRYDDFEQEFALMPDRWKSHDGVWKLDARGLRESSASWRPALLDGYLAPARTRVAGKRHVNDGALEFEVRIEGEWKRLVLRLTEQGDLFELELAPIASDKAQARLWRRTNTEKAELLSVCEVQLRAGEWHRVRWSNVDNHLSFVFDGRFATGASYDVNQPLKNMPDVGYRHLIPRVAFGGGELVAEFRAIRVLRDRHYTELGRHATDSAEQIGPDEVFVLGDNSGESNDSREWGPVKLVYVIGKPLYVVWPPARWRELTPREEDSRP